MNTPLLGMGVSNIAGVCVLQPPCFFTPPAFSSILYPQSATTVLDMNSQEQPHLWMQHWSSLTNKPPEWQTRPSWLLGWPSSIS